jgi:hypothetical protein
VRGLWDRISSHPTWSAVIAGLILLVVSGVWTSYGPRWFKNESAKTPTVLPTAPASTPLDPASSGQHAQESGRRSKTGPSETRPPKAEPLPSTKIEQHNAGPNSPNIVGNQNTVNFTNQSLPPNRSLNDIQREGIEKLIRQIPQHVTVVVKTVGDNREAETYALQFQEVLAKYSKTGNLIRGLLFQPRTPEGLWLVAHDEHDPGWLAAQEFGNGLLALNVTCNGLAANPSITAGSFTILIGVRPQQ